MALPAPVLCIPPPLPGEPPVAFMLRITLFRTVLEPAAVCSIPPPARIELFPLMVLFVTVSVPPMSLRIPPPLPASPVAELPVTIAWPLLLPLVIRKHQVTPLGANMVARAVGAKNLAPVNRSVWVVTEATGPFPGSGMVEFDFGNLESHQPNPPTNDTFGPDPHDLVRKLPSAMDQTNAFFRMGVVQPFCAGACDPE